MTTLPGIPYEKIHLMKSMLGMVYFSDEVRFVSFKTIKEAIMAFVKTNTEFTPKEKPKEKLSLITAYVFTQVNKMIADLTPLRGIQISRNLDCFHELNLNLNILATQGMKSSIRISTDDIKCQLKRLEPLLISCLADFTSKKICPGDYVCQDIESILRNIKKLAK